MKEQVKKEYVMCDKCKTCSNYLVSEIGCYGSNKPCEYYAWSMVPKIKGHSFLNIIDNERN